MNIIHKNPVRAIYKAREHCAELKLNGDINYAGLLSIPAKDRLPGLVAVYGFKNIHALVTVLLKNFANSYNLVRPMDDVQIVDCAATIVNSANEDYLSIEDLVLFFDNAKRGIYGRVLDHLDEPLVLEMLEQYREIRHRNYRRIVESESAQLKGMGSADRIHNDELSSKFYDLVGRLGYMKQQLKDK